MWVNGQHKQKPVFPLLFAMRKILVERLCVRLKSKAPKATNSAMIHQGPFKTLNAYNKGKMLLRIGN